MLLETIFNLFIIEDQLCQSCLAQSSYPDNRKDGQFLTPGTKQHLHYCLRISLPSNNILLINIRMRLHPLIPWHGLIFDEPELIHLDNKCINPLHYMLEPLSYLVLKK
uniref:Uncharacterized protein n=1 Tax=Arundo donax TaxID=35708 RepID=A0A0A8Y5M0_ARUDO